MPDEDQTQLQDGEEEATTGAKVGAVLLVLAVLAATYFLVKGLYPDDLAVSDDPSFVDTIFDNEIVVLAARLVLFSIAIVLAVGGLFVIVSTFVRMGRQDWLKRAGPFEVSERALGELEAQIEFWRDTALENQETIRDFAERLQASDELIERLYEEQESQPEGGTSA